MLNNISDHIGMMYQSSVNFNNEETKLYMTNYLFSIKNRFTNKPVEEVFSEAGSDINFPLAKERRKQKENITAGSPEIKNNLSPVNHEMVALIETPHRNQPDLNQKEISKELQITFEKNEVSEKNQLCEDSKKIDAQSEGERKNIEKVENEIVSKEIQVGDKSNQSDNLIKESNEENKDNLAEQHIDEVSEFSSISKRIQCNIFDKAIEKNPEYFKHITGKKKKKII